MKDFLKWGLIGFGAYMIYQQLSGVISPPLPDTPTTPTTNTPPATSINATTRQLLIDATGGGTPRTFHQWNYYYNNLPQGQTAIEPAPEMVGQGDGSQAITVDQYLAAIAQVGLSGFSDLWRIR